MTVRALRGRRSAAERRVRNPQDRTSALDPLAGPPEARPLGLRPVKHLGEAGGGVGADADLLQHADTRPAFIIAGPDDLLGVQVGGRERGRTQEH